MGLVGLTVCGYELHEPGTPSGSCYGGSASTNGGRSAKSGHLGYVKYENKCFSLVSSVSFVRFEWFVFEVLPASL